MNEKSGAPSLCAARESVLVSRTAGVVVAGENSLLYVYLFKKLIAIHRKIVCVCIERAVRSIKARPSGLLTYLRIYLLYVSLLKSQLPVKYVLYVLTQTTMSCLLLIINLQYM